MPDDPSEASTSPATPDAGEPRPTSPEARGQRWQAPRASPQLEVAEFEDALSRQLPINFYVLAIERWAIAVRRLEAGLIEEGDRAALLGRVEILDQFRKIPSLPPTPWVARLQRLFRRTPRDGQGDSQRDPEAR